MSPPPRVTVLSSELVERLDAPRLRDALDYADPDALCLTSPGALVRLRAVAPDLLDEYGPALVPGGGTERGSDDAADGPAHRSVCGVDLVAASADDDLAAVGALEREDRFDATTETYVLTDRLDVTVQLTDLEATLEGREAYRDALSPADLDGSYTHVSTAAPVGYHREWDGLTVAGADPDGDDAPGGERGGDEVPTLVLHADGTVCSTGIGTDRLGMRALPEVGEVRAERLREAGYRTPADVADATVADLREAAGVGRDTAGTIHDGARAMAAGEVVREGDEYFPDREPVFVDIETDGLTPTVVWLIGVLDRAGEERYLSFLNRDPDDPGRAVEAFVSWYAANAAGRPVVAYNGLSFDFPAIAEQVERHCPDLLDDWESAYTFDPYHWAVRDDNAILPGRTDKLGGVAAALGWDGDDAGLTGAAVGRAYRRWMRERTPEAEPEWERHERYCEDDVRALAHVYDALDAAGSEGGGGGERRETDGREAGGTATSEANTTQGTLGEFR
ncbi:ribonuclease H-like domain-containing protein [Halostella salina]|uniref:ribonuclease H-like domain-containing protein n=1 Tax=Halostella salina TaxID=1547897 RepID=UPI000EF8032A|nr:ribonuclease H-like domain-containing protein [Halostella salina]